MEASFRPRVVAAGLDSSLRACSNTCQDSSGCQVSSRENENIHDGLRQEERPENRPGLGRWVCSLIDEVSKMTAELSPSLTSSRQRQLAIVVSRANPHVPHQQGETDHQGCDAEGTTKFEVIGFAIGILWGLFLDCRICRLVLRCVPTSAPRSTHLDSLNGEIWWRLRIHCSDWSRKSNFNCPSYHLRREGMFREFESTGLCK